MTALLLTAAVAATITLGCYGLYRVECWWCGERPVKWFGF